MNKLLFGLMLIFVVGVSSAHDVIDDDVLDNLDQPKIGVTVTPFAPQYISVLIFLNSTADTTEVIDFLNQLGGIEANPLEFMPAIAAVVPKDKTVLNRIAEHVAVAQISSNRAGTEELEYSAQSILLTPSPSHPTVNNWWANGYTGKKGIIGLIDSGVAVNHIALINKKIILRKEEDSGYSDYAEGIRSAHGTGVACIYAGQGGSIFPRDIGIAFDAPTIVSGLAGEGIGEFKDLWQTINTLKWMLARAEEKPTLINYSFGNGVHACSTCSDWSGLAKVVDAVINQEKILWVKSAGNLGYVDPKHEAPYASTMTVPADNYNGITVANMNPTVSQGGVILQTADRTLHSISSRSSRGPTLLGRKKPDITAPGEYTWTCAPDPNQFHFSYTDAMQYQSGYRLMGGTSSAAPHVGAAILLMQDAGITSPIMQKALIINSADAWTDNDLPGPFDLAHSNHGEHYPVMGSEWNRTFGWGYINLQKAFDERHNLIESTLDLNHPVKEFLVTLPVGAKITLVHERRVGYEEKSEWGLSALSLEVFNADTMELVARDDSAIDSVHQVANCSRKMGDKGCSEADKEIKAIIRVTLVSPKIDGSNVEPFALAASVPFVPSTSRGYTLR